MPIPLQGLIAFAPTPLYPDQSLALESIPALAESLRANDINGVVLAGAYGEANTLSTNERMLLFRVWADNFKDRPLIAHVGSDSLEESMRCAAEAEARGCTAISAMPPLHFQNQPLAVMVDWLAAVASAAPLMPFYFHHRPAISKIHLPVDQLLEAAADRIPTLAGAIFIQADLAAFRRCVAQGFDMVWGLPESLDSAIDVGADAVLGPTVHLAAPLFHQLWQAAQRHDMDECDRLREVAHALADTLAPYGTVAAIKALFSDKGFRLGPVRPPLFTLTAESVASLKQDLEREGLLPYLIAARNDAT